MLRKICLDEGITDFATHQQSCKDKGFRLFDASTPDNVATPFYNLVVDQVHSPNPVYYYINGIVLSLPPSAPRWYSLDPSTPSSYQGTAVPGQCLTFELYHGEFRFQSVSCDETLPAYCEFLM